MDWQIVFNANKNAVMTSYNKPHTKIISLLIQRRDICGGHNQ